MNLDCKNYGAAPATNQKQKKPAAAPQGLSQFGKLLEHEKSPFVEADVRPILQILGPSYHR